MEKPYTTITVGNINQRVISLLGLDIAVDTPIFLGDSNIEHMKNEHPEDYEKYFHELQNILMTPDYVALHPKDNSTQYFKRFDVYVVVAVRVSKKGIYFARSIYEIPDRRFENYKRAGTLKKY